MRHVTGYLAVSWFLLLAFSATGSGQEAARIPPAPGLTTLPPVDTKAIDVKPIDIPTVPKIDTTIQQQAPAQQDLSTTRQPELARQASSLSGSPPPPKLDVEQECLTVEQQCNSACPVNHYLELTSSSSVQAEYSGCLGRVCHVTGPIEHCQEALAKALLEAWHARHDN